MSNSARLDRLESNVAQLMNVVRPGREEVHADWEKRLAQRLHDAEEAHAEIKHLAEGAAKEFHRLNTIFEEHMKVWEAAVKEAISLEEIGSSWRKKYLRHTVVAYIWGALFVAVAIFSGATFYQLSADRIQQLTQNALSQSISSLEIAAEYLLLGLPLAAGLILVIWFLRVAIRQFMSELSLAEDSAERRAMISTLQGLTLDSKFDVTQRMVVLQALFRIRAERTVDDAAPMDLAKALLDYAKRAKS